MPGILHCSGDRIRATVFKRLACWSWIPFVVLAVLALRVDPGLVRDGDQAAMLGGALRLADGASAWQPGFYAYDRSWLAYALTAGVFRMQRLGSGLPDPVAAGNVMTRLLFWGAWCLFLAGPGRRPGGRLAAWAVLATPAAWLSSLYWNTTALSSACVALGACAFVRKGRKQTVAASVAFGLAAGMRIDVLLLAPLLLWLFAPPSFPRGLRMGRGVWPVMAMLAALVIGRAAAGGGSGTFDWFFLPRAWGGYILFGAAGILWAALLAAAAWRPSFRNGRAFLLRAWGLAAVLIPWLFYLPQLHTPRYLLRAGEALLLLACSRRGRAWLQRAFAEHRARGVLLAAVVTLPLVTGLHLPFSDRPLPVWKQATRFPTGDGHYPMGAVADFVCRLQDAARRPPDHNHALWQAIRSADWPPPAAGAWPIMDSPQRGLFELHAALEGANLDWRAPGPPAPGPVYADSRVLMRRDPKQPAYDAAAALLEHPGRRVSPSFAGLFVVRIGEGNTDWSREIRLLKDLFGGAEFRVRPLRAGRADEGRTVVYFAEQPFAVEGRGNGVAPYEAPSARDEESGLYAVRLDGRARKNMLYTVRRGEKSVVRTAVGVFPDWMRAGGRGEEGKDIHHEDTKGTKGRGEEGKVHTEARRSRRRSDQ